MPQRHASPSGQDRVKLAKKTRKALDQLRRHDPDVVLSDAPTSTIFIGNSSVICHIDTPVLQSLVDRFDDAAPVQLIVYPSKRTYSFAQFSSPVAARAAVSALHGTVPESAPSTNQPLILLYVQNIPQASTTELVVPQGLQIVNDFVDENEEVELMQLLDAYEPVAMKHRAVLHFGVSFDYDRNAAAAADGQSTRPAPELIDQLWKRAVERGILTQQPDQITINFYDPGGGIPSHYDTHSAFEEEVASVSLSSDIVMEFKDGANSTRVLPVLLPQRSLVVMRQDARYKWKHGIACRQHDICPRTNRLFPRRRRVSITFRRIRHEPCSCDFPEYCDWDRNGTMGVPKDESQAVQIEKRFVRETYDQISSHFDETRHAHWTVVREFLASIPKHAILLDIGCGNGKYTADADATRTLLKIGSDLCLDLCRTARLKGAEVLASDAMHSPFRVGLADAAICIAVLHHLATRERRVRLLAAIARHLRIGGRALVTVWSMRQEGSAYETQRKNKDPNEDRRMERGDAPRLNIHDGRNFRQQDVLVPWQSTDDSEKTHLRYYHVFVAGELEDLLAQVPGVEIEKVELDNGNWSAVFRKTC